MDKQMLVQPFDLNGLPLKNRIVMAPMGRSRANDQQHTAGPLLATYYRQRASAGLIITEGTLVSEEANGGLNLPGLYNEEQVAAWRPVTEAVHRRGGRIFAQLWHTGRLSHPAFQRDGQLPLAPSALDPKAQVFTLDGLTDALIPQAMTLEDIQRTVRDFRQAAVNALAAGFDGVELQAGNGYLFHQFFSAYANQRVDEYGGSIEHRARLLFEVLDALQNALPLNRVGIRLNPSQHNILGMMLDAESIPVHEYIVRRLNDYDLAYLHLIEPFTPVDDNPHGVARVAKHFRPLYQGTLISNGGYTPATAEEAVENGAADLVSFGKDFIANPDLAERIQHGWPLSPADASTFFTGGEQGYTDHPPYQPGTRDSDIGPGPDSASISSLEHHPA